MRLLSALSLTGAGVAAYFATRQLLEHPERIDTLPEPLRPPVRALRARLELARMRADAVIAEAERGRAEAEYELMRDYRRRVGRPID